MNISYLNENLLPGHIGYLFVVLSFAASLLAFFSYLFYFRNQSFESWKTIGRVSFIVHGISVIGIFSTLFYLIYSHQFQYNYVWAHSSRDLPAQYMISCFWEGQEGSFLLWTFWHFILGFLLIRYAKKFEAPVLIVLCLAQIALSSMLLGQQINFGDLGILKIGSNPFLLLREAFPDLPVFTRPDYVNLIEDGRGLNVLLQNYWMVIHPPVLFLGFASTIVPFAFAMGGLWKKDYSGWVKPALSWTVFGCMMLGTGILMGGAWAYEALSFGGFWAWDPVENASLVPWLLFIGSLHTMIIFRSRKSSLGITFILTTLTFLLILYSTFLTRSGILGDTSVHSFTDLGLSGQLLIFIFIFVIVALISLIINWKKVPKSEKEEQIYSREFWMFIGALLLSLSALHIITITSIPVINKIDSLINYLFNSHLNTRYAAPKNVIDTYHSLQIPFAIFIAILSGIGQYLKYYKTEATAFWRKVAISFLISVCFTCLMIWVTGLYDLRYIILLWAAFFSICANFDVFLSYLKSSNIRIAGPSIAHIGFGLVLMGALIANAKKETISLNTEGFDALDKAPQKEQMENKVLFKDKPVTMGDFLVTYKGDSNDAHHLYYNVEYFKPNKNDKLKGEKFVLAPFVVFDKQKDEISAPSPSTRHYLSRDIFTHISAASKKSDSTHTFFVNQGDVVDYENVRIKVVDFINETDSTSRNYKLTMNLELTENGITYKASPAFILAGNTVDFQESNVKDLRMKLVYKMVHPEKEKKHELIIARSAPEFITMKAIVFPFINLLWSGSIIMIIGFFISLLRRIKENK